MNPKANRHRPSIARFDRTAAAPSVRRVAVMGGSYGNVPALDACIQDAEAAGCDLFTFLGDAIGCCGHSDETLDRIRDRFQILVAGNHERQAASGADTCGCGYDSPEDERYGCLAFQYAVKSLSETSRRWIATWPDRVVLDLSAGALLLCHGSPDRTNEFLYESCLDSRQLTGWLDECGATGFLCTHTGLPWIHPLPDGRFAANCGVVGKPDHDADPAVHYARVEIQESGIFKVEIRRVEYDFESWSRQLLSEGVNPIFVEPLRTGIWTTGVDSLPPRERRRPEESMPQ